ncbi:ERAP1-like C-terminal domain-containing protein [Nocardioides convexus]|uniref:ERAP1-like C-terminal domain-containing protein n=1 Tax=Nocardioides convexus TaxID=2712224 RepID=UPI002418420B|nr:ERAP1-like C-terminal domain-containing protein [Nocardioides convexus]
MLGNIGSESDAWGVSRIPVYAAQAVALYSDPTTRDEPRHPLGAGPAGAAGRRRAGHRPPDSPSPGPTPPRRAARPPWRTWRGCSTAAWSSRASPSTRTCAGRCSARWPDSARPTTPGSTPSLAGDNTISGQEMSAAARAAIGTPQAKERAWTQALLDPSVPNETQRSVVHAFWQAGQEEVLAPYVERYLAEVAGSWERLGAHKASVALEFIFPRRVATQATLDTVDAWLAENAETVNPGAVRYVREGRADVARALAAQARDAQR